MENLVIAQRAETPVLAVPVEDQNNTINAIEITVCSIDDVYVETINHTPYKICLRLEQCIIMICLLLLIIGIITCVSYIMYG